MRKALRCALRVFAFLVCTYVAAIALAHLSTDVINRHDVIAPLIGAVHWFVNHFAPSIIEPDDIETLYITALVLACWIAAGIVGFALLVLVRRFRAHQCHKPHS